MSFQQVRDFIEQTNSMSQKPNIFTFDIRKLSLFKNEMRKENNSTNGMATSEWFHFPQRSDITINFFKYSTDENSFHISIIWKGNVLDQTYWHQGTNNFISSIGKYPSLGFKIVTAKGELVKRFQVSFNTTDLYDKCCKCVQEKLNVVLSQKDATEVIENSQFIDNPSQKRVAMLQIPRIPSNSWENTSNNQEFYSPSQALCRPQYIPPPKQNAPFSQLERSASFSNITLEQRKKIQCESSQQVRESSQLPSNYFLPHYHQPDACYAQYQQPYTYLHTSAQPDMRNAGRQSGFMALESTYIDCNRDIVAPSNAKAMRSVDRNNQISPIGNQNHITNESIDNNVQPKNQAIDKNRIFVCDRPVNKDKWIKEEEASPTKIGNKFVLPKSSINRVQKSSNQKPKKKYDLFKMKDAELKTLVTEKLKDEKFIKFVERLDKIVSQP